MGRFASTVPFYLKARQPYGQAFFATVARDLAFGRHLRLLDLGTGPGLLALGFAPHVGEVWGVDPEPAMLDAARENARRSGSALGLIEGTAETLPSEIGSFDVVTIGRALHWMDPGRTRLALDRVVRPRGLVLVCSASSVADGRNPWLAAYERLRRRWAEGEESRTRYAERDAFFAATRFRADRTVHVETRHTVTVGDLSDRVLSMSSTSPDRLGSGVDAMREGLRAALEPFAAAGRLQEIVEARAEVFQDSG